MRALSAAASLLVGLALVLLAPTAQAHCPGHQHCDDAAPTTRLVFVTSATYDGALEPRPPGCGDVEGVLAGDCICQNHADLAGLPGDYMAWLSDDTGNPSKDFTQSAVPYVRLDGARVAANWDDLIDRTLISPIYVDESGWRPSEDSGTRAWTGTNTDGTANDGDCNGWMSMLGAVTGLMGATDRTDVNWTEDSGSGCNLEAHLYCFEQ